MIPGSLNCSNDFIYIIADRLNANETRQKIPAQDITPPQHVTGYYFCQNKDEDLKRPAV